MKKVLCLAVMTGCYTQNLTVENTLDASLIATMSTAAKPPQEFEVPRLKPSLSYDVVGQAERFAPAKESEAGSPALNSLTADQNQGGLPSQQPASVPGSAIEKEPGQTEAASEKANELPLSVSQVPAEAFDRGFSVQSLETRPAPELPEGVKAGAEDTMGGDDELWHLKQGVLD